MSKQRIPGQTWGQLGKTLRQFAELIHWSYPIEQREKHREMVLRHKTVDAELVAQSRTYIDGDCCGMLILTNVAPTKVRRYKDEPYEDPDY